MLDLSYVITSYSIHYTKLYDTYKINNGHVFRLKEWEMGEKEMLKKFYDLVVDLQRGSGTDRLKIIGHNILRFDLFFIS